MANEKNVVCEGGLSLFKSRCKKVLRGRQFTTPAMEGNDACVACLSALNLLFWGHKEACAVMYKVA
jgi:hypothetical protein